MALIKIRGRLEAISIDDARARKIKERKFGVEGKIPKAEPNELIDLGDWAGEYGRIVEIEMSKKPESHADEEVAERLEKERDEKWFAAPAKDKAKGLEWFKLCYSSRTKNWKWEPEPEVAQKAIAIQEKWFTENPRTFKTPASEFVDLLPSLARKPGTVTSGESSFDGLSF